MSDDFRPYESPRCISAFIEENQDEFEMWCTNRDLNFVMPTTETEIKFCEANDTAFDNFAWNWRESQIEESAESKDDDEGLL